MTTLSTHVLDLHTGRPVDGLEVRLSHHVDGNWVDLGKARTDADGRAKDFAARSLGPGQHRLVFDTGGYFAARGVDCFYPRVEIMFTVGDNDRHLHVPLLVAPFGYTTYRGS
jgi:5-hydroxyisourate hydrolase